MLQRLGPRPRRLIGVLDAVALALLTGPGLYVLTQLDEPSAGDPVPPGVLVAVAALIAGAALGLVLSVVHIVHAATDPSLGERRVPWLVALALLGPFVALLHWWRHLRPT